jgi:two-component system LytT family response regulator
VVLANGKKVVVSKVLKDIDEATERPRLLPRAQFLPDQCQPHQEIRTRGWRYLIMDDDMNISISRNRRQEFMEVVSKF